MKKFNDIVEWVLLIGNILVIGKYLIYWKEVREIPSIAMIILLICLSQFILENKWLKKEMEKNETI
jgi:hypothetical protein